MHDGPPAVDDPESPSGIPESSHGSVNLAWSGRCPADGGDGVTHMVSPQPMPRQDPPRQAPSLDWLWPPPGETPLLLEEQQEIRSSAANPPPSLVGVAVLEKSDKEFGPSPRIGRCFRLRVGFPFGWLPSSPWSPRSLHYALQGTPDVRRIVDDAVGGFQCALRARLALRGAQLTPVCDEQHEYCQIHEHREHPY